MRFTVFTPTYNRAYIIENLYHSLQRQTFRDFEWVVVDDGSSDNTPELFARILEEENFFPIQYIRVENGGKHRAINRGVQAAQGTLFCIVDSDDFLRDNALEIADQIERTIPADQKAAFAGVCGLRVYPNGNMLGNTFSGDTIDATNLERDQLHITGDKAEVYYTELLKQYPFPAFEGEKFITECVVWDKIASDGYKLRFFNQPVIVCEYRDDGLTSQGNAIFRKNPKGYGLYLAQAVQYNTLTGMKKWNELLDYYGLLRNNHSMLEIARNLQMNPLKLWLRLLGLRIFYKLYGRW